MHWPNPQDPRVVQMIRDWWELHPDDDPSALELDDMRLTTDRYRRALHRKINTASDGELETLVVADDLHWVFLVGFAASRADL